MDHFLVHEQQLWCESVPLTAIAAAVGTPTYVYSRATLERHWHAFNDALAPLPHLVCYAVKANSNIALLNLLARLGSGFDIVSIGELERVVAAGGDPAKVVFSGVGKRIDEIERALDLGIYCFNVESASELHRLNAIAEQRGVRAPVSLRVNPDVDAKTHPYISTGLRENKFGVTVESALELYTAAAQMGGVRLLGIDCHIGSQLTELEPFIAALERILHLMDLLKARGIELEHLDMGGGLGIPYRDEQPPLPADYAHALISRLNGRALKVMIEPGRALIGNAGVLLTRVEYLKDQGEKRFAIVDAAMNDLIRPMLYEAWQAVVPVVERVGEARITEIVGPICETGDFLAKDRELVLAEGDLLVIRSAGAYGFSMSSNYNSRPRAAEVLVDGDQFYTIRARETLASLYAEERLLPE